MKLFRVQVVDGLRRARQGFGIAWADSPEKAQAVVTKYIGDQTAYGKPFEASEVTDQGASQGPHVVLFHWGLWPDYPEEVEGQALENPAWLTAHPDAPLPDDPRERFDALEARFLEALREGGDRPTLQPLASQVAIAAKDWEAAAYADFFSAREEGDPSARAVIELEIDAERAELLREVWVDFAAALLD